MCQEEFTVEAIQPHAATCDGTPPTRKRPLIPQITKPMSLNPSKRPDRLPHPHFSGLKDTALRKKMSEQGISTAGSRQLMEKRYIEWVTLWNADCDSNHPKGRGALKRELDIWERTQGGRAVVGGREYAAGREIRDKDFDREAWGKSNGDDFKKLIADARRKAKAKNEEGSGERPTLAGSNSGTPQERPDIEISGGGRGPLEPLPPGFSPPQASLPPTFTQPRVEDSPTKYAMPALYREPTGEPSMAPPSSQYQPSSYQPSSSLNKDTSLNSSDISPMRSLQP
jgi:E3 ubiquitin-protein ligase RAD18